MTLLWGQICELFHRGATSVPRDPIADALVRSMRGDTQIPPQIQHVAETCASAYRRSALEALYVAGAGHADISRVVGIPDDVSRICASLLLPASVFRDQLALREWSTREIHDLAGSSDPDAVRRRAWLVVAQDHGLDFLLGEIAGGAYEPDLDTLCDRAVTTTYRRAMVAVAGAPVGSEAAADARSEMAQFLTAVQVSAKMRKEGRRAQLRAAQDNSPALRVNLVDPAAWESPDTSASARRAALDEGVLDNNMIAT